jgi:hypothetical protein
VRYGLLAVSTAFGFLLLAHTGWSSLAAAIAGPVGALTAGGIARLRVVRRDPQTATQPAAVPAMTG